MVTTRARLRPLLVPGVILTAALVRLLYLNQESYWFDEIWAVNQVRGSLASVLESLASEDVHPPLYPILLWFWVRLLGEAEWATRLLSVIAGTGAVGVLYLLGRDLFGRTTGVLAAGILALHAYAVSFSQETRAYSLLLFLGTWCTWRLVRWCQNADDRKCMWSYALSALPLLYVHVYGAFLLAAHGLYVLIWRAPMRRRMIGLSSVLLLLFLPWILVLLEQVGRVQSGFWIDPISWDDPVRWIYYWAGYNIPLAVLFFGLIVVGAIRSAPARPLLLLWIGVPLALPIFASFVGEPIFQAKYPMYILSAFCLLAARGLLALSTKKQPWVGGLLLVLLASGLPLTLYGKVNKEQYRELAVIGREEVSRGTLVVADVETRPYLSFYWPDAPVTWIENEDQILEATQATVEANGELIYLLVHPKTHPERELLLEGGLNRVSEMVLKEARVLFYRAPHRQIR